jgi:hypothetical protein
MQLKESNKIKRKNFFTKSISGFFGLTLAAQFPFNLFKKEKKIIIEINPHSVSRKTGNKNV